MLTKKSKFSNQQTSSIVIYLFTRGISLVLNSWKNYGVLRRTNRSSVLRTQHCSGALEGVGY
jgi:hypothetical protein